MTNIAKNRAEEIVRFRRENGCFVEKEELKDIVGIAELTYNSIKDKLKCSAVEFKKMTTATYRRHNKHKFDYLEREYGYEFHVGHIVADRNGGAPHPDNYLIIPAGINLAIQHWHDDIMFWLAGRDKTAKAVKATRRYSVYRKYSMDRSYSVYPVTVAEAEELRGKAKTKLATILSRGQLQQVDDFRKIPKVSVGGEEQGAAAACEDIPMLAIVNKGYCQTILDTWRSLDHD